MDEDVTTVVVDVGKDKDSCDEPIEDSSGADIAVGEDGYC